MSLSVNVADGGIDASVKDCEDLSDLVKAGFTGYQIKAGDSFKPWQLGTIQSELLGKNEPRKENLGTSVRACLDRGGTYVLVCFGHDFVEPQQEQALNNLISLFTQCGYTNPQVEVWGQTAIIGFVQRFPSLVLQLQGLDQNSVSDA